MEPGQEVIDRVRRIETRVTKIGNHLGVDVGGAKPAWDETRRRVVLPTGNCSIKECLEIIPASWAGSLVAIFVGEQQLTEIRAGSP